MTKFVCYVAIPETCTDYDMDKRIQAAKDAVNVSGILGTGDTIVFLRSDKTKIDTLWENDTSTNSVVLNG